MNSITSIFAKTPFFKLINLGLRVSGMGSKFIVAILLSKFYNDLEYRDYTLITTVVTISIYLLGLDFYNFSIRDILMDKSSSNVTNKLVSTFAFYLIIYLLFSLIYSLFYQHISFINKYAFLILALAITEHISQEIYRLLIAFSKILTANILLFIRTVGWVVIILYKIYFEEPFSIDFLLRIWIVSNIITILYILMITLFNNFKSIISSNIEKDWIVKGLKISSVFFVGTILLKIIEYANRFIIDYFLEEKYVGIYGFYSTIAIIVTVYINTIVISFELPPLIKSYKTSGFKAKYSSFKKSLRQQIIFIIILLLIIIKPILYWQNKESYQSYLPLFLLILTSVLLMNYSLAEHFKLYILHKDKRILYILTVSGIVSLLSAILFTYLFGLYGTGVSFLLTGVLMYFLRIHESNKLQIEND